VHHLRIQPSLNMRSEVLTTTKIFLVFWVVMFGELIGKYRILTPSVWSKDGDSMFLRNVVIYLRAHTAFKSSRLRFLFVVYLKTLFQ
jgi:hypothetical protein